MKDVQDTLLEEESYPCTEDTVYDKPCQQGIYQL